jgi:signal transduction histidine kinase
MTKSEQQIHENRASIRLRSDSFLLANDSRRSGSNEFSMNHSQSKFWSFGSQFLLGTIALALLTLVCFRYQVNSTTVALLYLIVIGLVSLQGNFIPSALVSIIAYICLDFFFTEPLFTLGMSQILDIVAPITYVTSAIVITRLISNARRSNEERKRAEEILRKAQAELAHVTRVMTMGEMATSIAHEINQPLSAVVNNASACLRWLAGDSPNLDEAREAAQRIIRDGKRASEVIQRIRTFLRKADTEKTRLDLNKIIQEVLTLTRKEAERSDITVRMDLDTDLPKVLGDRVQLQQVILNLVINAIEAISAVTDGPRELVIGSHEHENDKVLVYVQDSGMGVDGQSAQSIFDPFYTTKSNGMGMGLAISRSIVEDHGGRLWAASNDGPGATFQFTILKYQYVQN